MFPQFEKYSNKNTSPHWGVWPLKILWYTYGAWAHWFVFVLRFGKLYVHLFKRHATFHNNLAYGEEQFRVTYVFTDFYRFLLILTYFYWFWLILTDFDWFWLIFTDFYWFWPIFTDFYWFLPIWMNYHSIKVRKCGLWTNQLQPGPFS